MNPDYHSWKSLTSPLAPLQPETLVKTTASVGWKGEFRREGASPPLLFSPPLEHNNLRVLNIILFERGIKGVSI
jgi:hypothetical protein